MGTRTPNINLYVPEDGEGHPPAPGALDHDWSPELAQNFADIDTAVGDLTDADTELADADAIATAARLLEATTREDADLAEAAAREAADADLQTAIDNIDTGAGAALGVRIDNEITDRGAADATLTSDLDDEVTARTDGDANLQTQIDLIGDPDTSGLQTQIDDEVAAREDGDAYLQGQINSGGGGGSGPHHIISTTHDDTNTSNTPAEGEVLTYLSGEWQAVAPDIVTGGGGAGGWITTDDYADLPQYDFTGQETIGNYGSARLVTTDGTVWSSATAYVIGDVVTFGGASYVCVLGHTNHTPPNVTYWLSNGHAVDTVTVSMIGKTNKGAWSGATAYVVNDVVQLSGAAYVCILAHTNHTPPNATYWTAMQSVQAWIKATGDPLVAPGKLYLNLPSTVPITGRRHLLVDVRAANFGSAGSNDSERNKWGLWATSGAALGGTKIGSTSFTPTNMPDPFAFTTIAVTLFGVQDIASIGIIQEGVGVAGYQARWYIDNIRLAPATPIDQALYYGSASSIMIPARYPSVIEQLPVQLGGNQAVLDLRPGKQHGGIIRVSDYQIDSTGQVDVTDALVSLFASLQDYDTLEFDPRGIYRVTGAGFPLEYSGDYVTIDGKGCRFRVTAQSTDTTHRWFNVTGRGSVMKNIKMFGEKTTTYNGSKGQPLRSRTGSAWSGATAYVVGNVVTLAGVAYVCILGNTGQTPPNTTYWTASNAIGYSLQSITAKGGGTYTLTYNGQTTSPAITSPSTAATMQAALEALSTIDPGDISVTGTYPNFNVQFIGPKAANNLPITGNGAALTGGGHELTIAGVTRRLAIQGDQISVAPLNSSGHPDIMGRIYTEENRVTFKAWDTAHTPSTLLAPELTVCVSPFYPITGIYNGADVSVPSGENLLFDPLTNGGADGTIISFFQGAGGSSPAEWTPTNCTQVVEKGKGSWKNNGSLKMTCTAAGEMSVLLSPPNTPTNGIKIIDDPVGYRLAFQASKKGTRRFYRGDVLWYNNAGTLVGTSTGTGGLLAQNSKSGKRGNPFGRYSGPVIPPQGVGATFARIRIAVQGASTGTAAVQTATLTGFDGTDSFHINYGGAESALITRGGNYNAPGIKAAIEAIAGFPTTVTVTGGTDSGFIVTFASLAPQPLMTITNASGVTGVFAHTTPGAGPDVGWIDAIALTPNMTAAVSLGGGRINSGDVVIPATAGLTVTPQDDTMPRIDYVLYSLTTNTVIVRAGTPAPVPDYPNTDPTTEVVCGALFLSAAQDDPTPGDLNTGDVGKANVNIIPTEKFTIYRNGVSVGIEDAVNRKLLTLDGTPTVYTVAWKPKDLRARYIVTLRKASTAVNSISIDQVQTMNETAYDNSLALSAGIVVTGTNCLVSNCLAEGTGGDGLTILGDLAVGNVVEDFMSRSAGRDNIAVIGGRNHTLRRVQMIGGGRNNMDFENEGTPSSPFGWIDRFIMQDIFMFAGNQCGVTFAASQDQHQFEWDRFEVWNDEGHAFGYATQTEVGALGGWMRDMVFHRPDDLTPGALNVQLGGSQMEFSRITTVGGITFVGRGYDPTVGQQEYAMASGLRITRGFNLIKDITIINPVQGGAFVLNQPGCIVDGVRFMQARGDMPAYFNPARVVNGGASDVFAPIQVLPDTIMKNIDPRAYISMMPTTMKGPVGVPDVFYPRGMDMLSVPVAGVRALSASPVKGNNLRGVDVAIGSGVTSLDVSFPTRSGVQTNQAGLTTNNGTNGDLILGTYRYSVSARTRFGGPLIATTEVSQAIADIPNGSVVIRLSAAYDVASGTQFESLTFWRRIGSGVYDTRWDVIPLTDYTGQGLTAGNAGWEDRGSLGLFPPLNWVGYANDGHDPISRAPLLPNGDDNPYYPPNQTPPGPVPDAALFNPTIDQTGWEPDTNYGVFVSTTFDNGGYWITNKLLSGFTVNWKTATANASQKLSWMIVR